MPLIKSLILFLSLTGLTYSYDSSGINSTVNFGTIVAPFPDLTSINRNICVGYTLSSDPSNYYVTATSSNTSTTTFQLANTSNNAYKLNYSVAWAGSASNNASFVSLLSGQSSSTSFPAQLLGSLSCALLMPNASLKIIILNSDQILAKSGTYTDTLTVLISAS